MLCRIFIFFVAWIVLSSSTWALNVEAAAAYSQTRGERALAVKSGREILLERYDSNLDATSRFPIFSITKSLAALAVFQAENEGLLTLDEPVSQTITEWRNDPLRRGITLRQLLNQTSGLNPGYREIYRAKTKDKNRVAVQLNRQFVEVSFQYGPSHFEVLEEVLRRKLERRGTNTLQYLAKHVLGPARGHSQGWRADAVGNPYFSTGAYMSLREMVNMGEWVLHSCPRFLSSRLLQRRREELYAGSPANPMYGLAFWNNRLATQDGVREVNPERGIAMHGIGHWQKACLARNAPADLLAMVGSGGQRIYLSPSRNLVVARQGTGHRFDDSEFLSRLFSN